MEYDIRITIAEHGRDEDAGSQLLAGFEATHPDTGPVADQNLRTGDLSIMFTVELDDPDPLRAARDVIDLATPIFDDGANASGLKPTPILGVEITPVPAEDREPVVA